MLKRFLAIAAVMLLAFAQACAAETDMVSAHIQMVCDQTQLAAEDETAVLSHEISHDSERYVSLVFSFSTMSGSAQHETIWADTLARDGLYAGQELTLSQILGLEQEDAEGRSVAAALAYDLIWQIVEQEQADPDAGYRDGLTKAELEAAFDPETDFHLDEDGNVVFFIQSGEAAAEVAGVLRFPFAPAELLSAVHE